MDHRPKTIVTRWLLTGVLICGDCGHKFWSEPRHRGKKPGQVEVITNCYTCAGRRRHGPTICPTPLTLRREEIESWTLGKLQDLIQTDEDAIETAIERYIAAAGHQSSSAVEIQRLTRDLKQVNDTVTALTMSIDPSNLSLLNDRLT